ncbi:MAG TPA: ATP-binding protein [Ferruginibacter sp.]|jgi:signal transduction histidine kinase|nr:ATP-binding protein [Ferruginibacter sp.]
MKDKTSIRRRIKDISIAKKLYFIVGTMAILIVVELFTLWFAIHTLSSLRALVGAEGLWSKAEKDAVYELNKYYRTHDEKDYASFQKFMRVPEGDHTTRMELLKKDMDINVARQGFIEGRVHPADIDGMISMLRRFYKVSYLSKAIFIWGQGDSTISELVPIGQKIKEQINAPHPSQQILDSLLNRADIINGQVTQLEDDFSYTLGEGSRWLEHLVLELLFSVALIVEITGLTLSISVSRNITKGLRGIIATTDKIKRGDLAVRAPVYSGDEIGQLATAMNQMAEQLILSNQELFNFAYIASHDLQEPLRKINVFTNLLESESNETISDKSKMYMERITRSSLRMQKLIGDILQLSRLNTTEEFEEINLSSIIADVTSDIETLLTRSNAIVTVQPLPTIEANAMQMRQLFQNLFSNSIKFNNKQPHIDILYELIDGRSLPDQYWATAPYKFTKENDQHQANEKFCRISFKDNGIGFEEQYLNRIFVIFQRLNSKHLYEGSGIGLAVCLKIVKNHHGIISARSIPDEGTDFIITLPLSQKNFNTPNI